MQDETLVSVGTELKSLGLTADGKERIGGYLVVFGDSSNTDQAGDWFTPQTYFGFNQGNGSDCMIHHGFPLKANVPEIRWTQDKLLPPLKTHRDDLGIFAETVCDLSDRHEAKIAELARAGKFRWSSGSSDQHVRRRNGARKGEITYWPIVEGSLTPTPCQATGTGISSLKALLESEDVEEVVEALKYSPSQPRDDDGKWTIIAGSKHRISGRQVSKEDVQAMAKEHRVSERGTQLLLEAHDEGKIKTDDHLLRAIAHGIHHAEGHESNASYIAAGINKHGVGGTHANRFGGWEGFSPHVENMRMDEPVRAEHTFVNSAFGRQIRGIDEKPMSPKEARAELQAARAAYKEANDSYQAHRAVQRNASLQDRLGNPAMDAQAIANESTRTYNARNAAQARLDAARARVDRMAGSRKSLGDDECLHELREQVEMAESQHHEAIDALHDFMLGQLDEPAPSEVKADGAQVPMDATALRAPTKSEIGDYVKSRLALSGVI